MAPQGRSTLLEPFHSTPRPMLSTSEHSHPLLAPQSILKTRQSSQTPSPNLKSLALQFLTHSIAPNLPLSHLLDDPKKLGKPPSLSTSQTISIHSPS